MDVSVLTPAIGAVINAVDLSQRLDEATIGEIRKALLKHQVIFFQDQHLTPSQHRDFAARFGALHTHPLYPGVDDAKELFILDNHGGNPTDNDAWHSDVTFIETPPMGSILYARQLPPAGGDTIWSNMREAYLGLSEPFRDFLKGLDAVHDFARGFPAAGAVAKAAGEDTHAKARAQHPPVVHPVIRTHPETGEDGLFVNYGFTSRILGVSRKESAAILKLLHEHIQQPEYLVRWHWTANAVAFWDNRVTQHYAVNDYLPHRRIMHRATILGERPYQQARMNRNLAAE